MPGHGDDEDKFWHYANAERLYRHNGEFRQLVDVLMHSIDRLQLTPGEIRTAAVYAAIRWEMIHPKPVILRKEDIDPQMLKELQRPGRIEIYEIRRKTEEET